MAVDMFLEIDGVKGESVDKVHKDKIDIMSWQWGIANSGTFHHGSGEERLTENVALNFAKVKIEYVTVEFDKVLVTSYATGGSGGQERLTEHVTLNFAKVKVEYTTQSEKGGKGTPHAFSWDIAQNTKP